MLRSTLPLFALAFAMAAPALAAEVIPVPAFRGVELQGGGNVTIVPGATQRVTLLEGSSQITRFRVENNGRLRIDACGGVCPQHYRFRVEIQSPSVPSLAVNGGGTIATAGGFRSQSELAAAVNGGGKVDARALDVESVSAAVNGGGELLVRPRARLSAAVNGGGHIRFWGNPAVSSAVRGGGSVGPGY